MANDCQPTELKKENPTSKHTTFQRYLSTKSADEVEQDEEIIRAIMVLNGFYCNNDIPNVDFVLKDITSMIEGLQLDSLPGLVENEIPKLILQILQNPDYFPRYFRVFYFLTVLTSKSDLINQLFLTPSFLRLFASFLKQGFDNDTIDSYRNLLFVIYNLTFSMTVRQQSYFLSFFSIKDFYNISITITDEDLIVRILLCVRNLSKLSLDAEDENYVLIIISHFSKMQMSPSGTAGFLKCSLWTLIYLLQSHSFNISLFHELQLNLFLSFYLEKPPIETQSLVCRIIYFLCHDHNYSFEFNFDYILNMVIHSRSLNEQLSSALALHGIVETNKTIAQELMHLNIGDSNIMYIFYQNFNDFWIKTKLQILCILDVFASLASYSDLILFYSANDDISIFDVLSNAIDTQENEMLSISIKVLLKVFQLAESCNDLMNCCDKFLSVCDLDEFASSFDDGNVKKMLEKKLISF